MEAGNVTEFVDNLALQDEAVLYRGMLYYFYGVRLNKETGHYYTSIDRFKDDIHHFVDEFYSYEGISFEDCLSHLLEDKIWDGKSFYEAEREMKWVDW